MDKRFSKRIPVSIEAHITWGDITYRVFITDVSESGLYVIAPSGEKEFAGRNRSSAIVNFQSSPGHMMTLHCKEIRSDADAAEHSTQTIGLEIQNPPAEYKEFYRTCFFRIKKDMSHDAIAVVGMACYYPDAPDLKSFWENVLARRRAFRRIPDSRLPLSEYYDADPLAPDKTYANRAAVIDGFEFDWVKRGIPKSVVESSDIAHWLALEVAIRAMEDAGYSKGNTPSDRSGVILGNTLTGEHSRSQNMRLRWPYVKKTLEAAARKKQLPADVVEDLVATMETYYKSAFAPVTEDTLAGNLSNTIAGRICNFLDLHGGGYTVDGACSSSLIALATAANALSTGTLDLALVGGVDISLDTFELVGFAKTNALTRKDMKVYDRNASGFIPGEGAGFVILKRLQNARAHGNYIYAIMRGWGMSSDGKGGMTAPKAQTQTLAIRRAYGKAGYGLDDIDFIEGHGTGTVAGDRAELEGIADALGDKNAGRLRSCGITSLKSLIGHTKAASGIGGFIKAVMAVNRRVVPPTAGLREPNPVFDQKARRIYAVTQGEVRNPDDTMRAGVSGMGFGGINVHVTIESDGKPARHLDPSIGERELFASYQETELFVLSAGSQSEMLDRLKTLKVFAIGMSVSEMADLSKYLTQNISSDSSYRAAFVAETPEHAVECLDSIEQMLNSRSIPEGKAVSSPRQDVWIGNHATRHRIGFLFPGQGSQQLNMGTRLVERYPWAREFMAKTDLWLSEDGHDKIYDYIYRPLDRAADGKQTAEWLSLLSDSKIAQPAICMNSLLWMRHLEHLGIRPFIAGGHSLGELSAFHAAGSFDDRTLLRLAAFRGKVTSASDEKAGTMAVFACGREKTEGLLKEIEGYVAIANINGPMQTVISGEKSAVEKAVHAASLLDIKAKYLPVSNAFHSRFMVGAADKIQRYAPVSGTFDDLDIKLLSSLDGQLVPRGTDLRTHFAKQVTSRVDFVSLVSNIRKECDLLVEVGPGRVLSGLVESMAGKDGMTCLPLEATAGDDRSLNVMLASYFVHGGSINWQSFFENRMIRPFIPASERLFIDNPCERSLGMLDELREDELSHRTSSVDQNHIAVNDDSVGLFSHQQIAYIRRLIQEQTGAAVELKSNKHSVKKQLSEPPQPAAVTQKTIETDIAAQSSDAILALASEMTGFPVGSISLDHRLLDNLNLDSIKAGIFVAKAAKLYGAERLSDPSALANSTLREIYEAVLAQSAPSQKHAEQVESAPVQQVSDLPEPAGHDNWVRSFKITYEKSNLVSPYTFEEIIAAARVENKKVLIVCRHDDRLGPQLQTLLMQKDVAAKAIDYLQLGADGRHDFNCKEYDYFVFLLPQDESPSLLTGKEACDMAARMHCIGSVITDLKMRKEKPTYIAVQFGNGDFFKYDPNLSVKAKGAVAFLCGIHLENPSERIRILEFSNTADAFQILNKITEELHSDEVFGIAAYDGKFNRNIPIMTLASSESFQDRKIQWTGNDVVLVTGGAKGITAECAIAFARSTGVQLALVGSTVLIDNNDEIQNALSRFRENGITYRYYACNISERDGVEDLIRRIEKDLGAITGVIHGAAINKPRRVEQADLKDALSEIAPKLIGAINICECLMNKPPKLFVGFGSIIGVTGMSGNAWYGFANEALNLVLQQFASATAFTKTITCAFSIWNEVGMGTRMGSMSFLSRMGILPIPKGKGIDSFMQLACSDAGEPQVIVAGRMGTLNTIRKPAFVRPQRSRFLEEVLFYEKGVEIESGALLTLDKDPYLRDHCFNGTYLFPTVFGIEAMSQAVAAVMGRTGLDHLRMENILLSYPITVESGNPTEIRIRAIVEDSADSDKTIRIKAGITVDQTDFSKNHFEAEFVLDSQRRVERFDAEIPETMLDIKPDEDLYGHMLFQGGMFQKIKAVRQMNGTRCIFESEFEGSAHDSDQGSFTSGDPFFNDTLLQSIQIILPDVVALPIAIEKWESGTIPANSGSRRVVVDLLDKGDQIIVANVTSVDKNGNIVDRVSGYRTKIIEKLQNAPAVDDLINPDICDTTAINNKMSSYCKKMDAAIPALIVKHKNGLHGMTREARHPFVKDLFKAAYSNLRARNRDLPEQITVQWTENGKPFIVGSDKIGLSCSHDDRLCICAVGQGTQGCDIEPIKQRSPEAWKDLIGTMRSKLFDTICNMDKTPDFAGSRIWCALEALRKATDMTESDLKYDSRTNDCIIFSGGELTILTFPIKLLRGRERMVAVTVSGRGSVNQEAETTSHSFLASSDNEKGLFIDGGPQGQKMFTCRFSLGLRDNSSIGGGVYFANYFHWIGKVREKALKPIGKYITDEFSTGHFMVTNHTRTEITGHVRNHEVIDSRAWIQSALGDSNSSFILNFEWRKLKPDGKTTTVAVSQHHVSWIKVVGHGLVEPVPCPEFFMEFLQHNSLLPKLHSNKAGLNLDDMILSKDMLGRVLHKGNLLGEDVLAESIVDTTMEHSNIAQNIYFSNYYTWQGHLRDRYLFSLSPGDYKKMDGRGKFACVHCEVKHLREAMPFDRIYVAMKLKNIYERGVDLYFEYFKVEANGGKTKLAYGIHTLAWVSINGSDGYVPQNLPQSYAAKILARNQKIKWTASIIPS